MARLHLDEKSGAPSQKKEWHRHRQFHPKQKSNCTRRFFIRKMRAVAKKRIDVILTERGLADSRSQARALIMAGQVLVNDNLIDKAGALVNEDARLRLKGITKYVSRGGLKLEKALAEFGIDVHDAVCLDVGQSTGGFTDCLLQHGAKKVYGVDVGMLQLHRKIETDPRVVSFEKTNFRHFDLNLIREIIDVVVMDVSFISIKLIIPKILELMRRDSDNPILITLIKPQFEVGKGLVGKGGIVHDVAARVAIVNELTKFITENGFTDVRVTESPITGSDGNVEYLLMGRFVTS